MFEKLEIRGFFNHTRLNVEFGKGVTSIIGPNFAGKSSVIRAIKLVTRNTPAGDSFINWDSEKAAIRLVADGQKITRKRGRSENTYRLGKKDYVAFGNEVPCSIKEVLNVADVNFQAQQSAPFWFCETAGAVSRQLNAIVNLGVIDTTLSKIAAELHKANVAIEITQERLGEAVEEKGRLAYVGRLNKDLLVIEEHQNLFEETAGKRARLLDLLRTRAKYLKQQENALELGSEGRTVVSKGAVYQKVGSRVERLSVLVASGRALQKTIEARPPSLKPLRRLKEELLAAENSYCALLVIISKIETERKIKCKAEEELKVSKRAFRQAVGEVCPLCKQSWPKT